MSGGYELAMIRAVVDTHAVLWYLYADPRLSETARTFMEAVEGAGDLLAVSSITFAEVVYLTEKGRIPGTTFSSLRAEFERQGPVFVEVPFGRDIAQAMYLVPRDQVPDMPDRIIAATAIAVDVPLVTADGKIRRSALNTIW